MAGKPNPIYERIRKLGSDWVGEQIVRLGDDSGEKIVETETPGQLYARQYNGKVIRVYNSIGIAPDFDTRVRVVRSRFQPNKWRIVEVLEDYEKPANEGRIGYHHKQHEETGPDRVTLDRKQIRQLSCRPAGGFNVRIYGAAVPSSSGVVYVDNTTLSLSAFVVTVGARYVTIEADASGALSLNGGSSVASVDALTSAHIPAPASGKSSLYYILLYEGQTEIIDANIKPIIAIPGASLASSHSHFNDAEGDPEDVSITAPSDGTSSFSARRDHVHFYEGSEGTVITEDLTSQIPATGDHFDLASEAVGGSGLLFYNTTYQSPDTYTMDGDNLGLTLSFSPAAGDTLIFIHGISGVAVITDDHAIHDNESGEINAVTEKVTPVADDIILIEDSGAGYAKKRVKANNLVAILDPPGFYINFDVSTTTAGQNQNRTSGGTYVEHRAYITTYRPLKLNQVKWDVSSARTYRLRVYRGWQITTVFSDLGDQLSSGRTAELTWSAGDLLMMPGKYVLELSWTTAAVVDDNTIDSLANTPNMFNFFEIERTQYGPNFDGGFSAAIKLVAYLGNEVLP